MEITTLPFEYELRFNDNHKRMGFDMDQGVFMEERDRQLEDFLARSLAGGGKLPFYVAASDASAESKALSNYVCTGTNDETVIQQAVDDLVAYGDSIGAPYSFFRDAPLLFSEGVFYLSAEVNCTSLVTPQFRGAGMRRTFFQRVGTAGVAAAFNCGGAPSAEGMTFFDFYRPLYVSTTPVSPTEGARIRDCWFEDCSYPIWLNNADDAEITDCWFFDNITPIVVYASSELRISDNFFFSSSGQDIYASELESTTITGNVSKQSLQFLYLDNFTGSVTIANNNVVSLAGVGMQIDGAGTANLYGLNIVGNYMGANTNNVLEVDNFVIRAGDTPMSLKDNHFIGGVVLDVRAMVTGNYISGGITFHATCDKALCSNNWLGDTAVHGSAAPTLTDNTSGAIVSRGAGNYLNGTWTP